MKDVEYKKPPLGLRPRFIVIEQRLQEIREALARTLGYGWARKPAANSLDGERTASPRSCE